MRASGLWSEEEDGKGDICRSHQAGPQTWAWLGSLEGLDAGVSVRPRSQESAEGGMGPMGTEG